MRLKNPERLVKIASIALAIYLVGFGIAEAFFPIRPFWNDEWRLIYNIKFKTIPELWGRLDLLQECPRVYLTVLKFISANFDYNYISLRLPPLIITIVNLFFVFNLRKKIFPNNAILSYLFVLIIVSSQTFTDYIVQVKHYEIEIFACLTAMWQLLTLLKIGEEGWANNKFSYFLLCLSGAIITFFSYTYPIAIAPVFAVFFIRYFFSKEPGRASMLTVAFPLVLIAVSIITFYLIDVKQVMANNAMYQSYLRMMHNEVNEKHYLLDFWYLFALVGSGYLYEIIFGILGILAFLFGIYRIAAAKNNQTKERYVQIYAILLLTITIGLIVSGKLLGSVARLTSYTVPSIAILIVILIGNMRSIKHLKLAGTIISLALFLGLTGNIISTCINTFAYTEYSNRIRTYWNTGTALKEARRNKIPLFYTSAVDGDPKPKDPPKHGNIQTHEITAEQIAGADFLCAEVIVKVNPEYKVWDTVALYEMPDTKFMQIYVQQLPPPYQAAIAGDGVNYVKIERQ